MRRFNRLSRREVIALLCVLIGCSAMNSYAGWWGDWRKKQYEGYTKFHEAAKSGDIESLKRYLAQGENVDQQSRSAQCTALGCAVRWKKQKTAKLLLAHGADINVRNFGGIGTPLIMAVRNLQIDMVRFLLEHEADPSVTDYLRDLSALEWGEAMAEGKFARIPTPPGRTPTQEELRLAHEKHDEVMTMLKVRQRSKKNNANQKWNISKGSNTSQVHP